jgi:excisionase family DNA binding protein
MAEKREKLLSVADITEQANISRQRVLRIIENGDLKAELVGGSYVIRHSDFDAWFNSRRKTGRPRKVKNEKT